MHQGFYRYRYRNIFDWWTIVLSDQVILCNPAQQPHLTNGAFFSANDNFFRLHVKVL